MHKTLLAAVALTGLLALTSQQASAAPSIDLGRVQAVPTHGIVTNVDYEWHHHHWHHRRWHDGHWHYWD
jgi:hypothetical protein